MGDDQSCALIGIKCLCDLPLGEIVKSGGCLVEYKDIGLRRDGPCDQESLLLSARDPALSLRDHGLHAHGHLSDVLRDPGRFRRLPCVVQSEPGSRNSDIFKNTAHQELPVLHHHADMSAERSQVKAVDILAVIEHGAHPGLFKSKKDPHQRGLSAARLADDCHILSGFDPDAQIIQDVRHCLGVTEAHMVQFNIAAKPCHDLSSARHFRLLIQNGGHHLDSGTDSGDNEGNGRDFHKCGRNITIGRCKSHIVVIGDAAADRRAVHYYCSDQADRRADHRVHLYDHRRIIHILRFFRVQPCPARKGAFLGSGKLDLLDSRDHGIVHAVFLSGQFHGFPGDRGIEKR